MQSNRPLDTRLEIRFRSALHRAGLRYRKHVRPVPGLACTPDVVFTKSRVAVFFDGCWWHSCPVHASRPIRNAEWWSKKLDATKDRDRRNNAALQAAGWRVVRIWEHETPESAVSSVVRAVDEARPPADRRDPQYRTRSGKRRPA